MNLGKRLRQRRIQQGYTQQQLAELVGCSQQSINAIESNESVQPRKLSQIAACLETTPEWLQYGCGTPSTTIPAVSGAHLVPAIQWTTIEKQTLFDNKQLNSNNLIPIPIKFNQRCFALSINDTILLNKLGIQLPLALSTRVTLIVDPEASPKNDNYIVAWCNSHNTIRLYQYNKKGKSEYLNALNGAEKLSFNNIKIAGVVVHMGIDL